MQYLVSCAHFPLHCSIVEGPTGNRVGTWGPVLAALRHSAAFHSRHIRGSGALFSSEVPTNYIAAEGYERKRGINMHMQEHIFTEDGHSRHKQQCLTVILAQVTALCSNNRTQRRINTLNKGPLESETILATSTKGKGR